MVLDPKTKDAIVENCREHTQDGEIIYMPERSQGENIIRVIMHVVSKGDPISAVVDNEQETQNEDGAQSETLTFNESFDSARISPPVYLSEIYKIMNRKSVAIFEIRGEYPFVGYYTDSTREYLHSQEQPRAFDEERLEQHVNFDWKMEEGLLWLTEMDKCIPIPFPRSKITMRFLLANQIVKFSENRILILEGPNGAELLPATLAPAITKPKIKSKECFMTYKTFCRMPELLSNKETVLRIAGKHTLIRKYDEEGLLNGFPEEKSSWQITFIGIDNGKDEEEKKMKIHPVPISSRPTSTTKK
jgi:hypothetical protein